MRLLTKGALLMTALLRRLGAVHGLRATAVAIVALALTVGMAFAANPNGHNPQGKANGHHGPQASEGPKGSDETEGPEGSDESDASTDSHGALVSAAAHRATPAGFKNHGAFVSCVAHMKDVTLATINWSSVTPSSCAAAKSDEGADH